MIPIDVVIPGEDAAEEAARPAGSIPLPAGVQLSAAKLALREARLRGATRAAPLAARPRGEEVPLSFGQERLWFLDRLQPGFTAYNLAGGMRLQGALDAAALERALGEMVRRHESLRTVFRDRDGVPAQVVLPFVSFSLPVETASVDDHGRAEAVRRRAAALADEPFDLAAGPLLRALLLRFDAEDHALMLCMHHIVCDGWSMGVFLDELTALYAAFREGRPSPLPPLPIQYPDFAVWQREQWQAAEARQLAYWTERLSGAPELLELPADRPRPPVPSFCGGTVPVVIPLTVLEQVRALAQAENATPFMVVLAAFQALLSRYSGADDIVIGTPTAGRTRKEVERLVGLFANTLVVRTDLSGDPTFRALVRRVREDALADFAHQDTPFERLVAALRPERSLSHATLFQVLFQLESVAEGTGEGGGGMAGLRAGGLEAVSESAKFDLSMILYAHDRGITGMLEYGTDLFDHATATRMVDHLAAILRQIGEDADVRISRLRLAAPEERERVAGWNRTAAPYPAERCIHHLFEDQAARTPLDVAVAWEGGALTYGEVDARANRIARFLRRLGVGPEVRVGLCLERGREMIPALLGVLKAGGTYVPMDPSHPPERLAYMLADSGASILLTQARLRDRFPGLDGVRIVAVDAERERIAAEDAARPESGVTAENLCYVMYTSGSTGRPKGVAMHHRGVANYLDWAARSYPVGRGSGAPLFTSMAVDLTITNLLPLFAGRAVRLLPEEGAVEALAAVLREAPGFGVIKITPVHLGLLNAMLDPAQLAGAAHALVIGAEVLSAELTHPWQEHAPAVRLVNEYGPTETVVGCSAYVLPADVQRTGPVPVGRAIQNLSLHVLDAHGEPVPIGLPGELHVGGVGVARGYLGRPGLTAEKFVPDPFAGPGARMYRTGDRARWLDSGELMILGRMDHQVKVRGYRVELGEIEAVLRRHPAVAECRVVMREDRPGDRRLVAYAAGQAEADALRAHLRLSLPDYMVPEAFVVLEALPRSSTGKVDPRTLPAPAYAAVAADFGEPCNYVEAQLILLWEELLGVKGIGPAQSWFQLGGNSLLALRLFTRANRLLECDLPVSTLFTGATVRHMADAVLAQKRGGAAPVESIVPLQPHGALPPLFVVHSADRNVMGYVNLVRHLGAEQPVFGIRDVGEDLGRPVAQIAAEHVEALRIAQPRGPYSLASWSFGGVVAFEMALQLERAGETVAFLGLLDTLSPALNAELSVEGAADLVVGLAGEVAEEARRTFSMPAEGLRGLELDEQVRRVAAELRAQEAAPPGFTAEGLGMAVRAVLDRVRSSAGYVPGRLAGTLTLFRAGTPDPRREAFFASRSAEERESMGWAPLCARPVEVHVIPGTHVTLASEPHVRLLAERMRAALASARAEDPGRE